MSNLVRIGDIVINKNSISQVKIMTIEYPTRYVPEQKSKNSKKKFFDKLGDIVSSMVDSVVMKQVRVLYITTSDMGGISDMWLYNDSIFGNELSNITTIYEKYAHKYNFPQSWSSEGKPSDYVMACCKFYEKSPAIYPVNSDLDKFIDDLLK